MKQSQHLSSDRLNLFFDEKKKRKKGTCSSIMGMNIPLKLQVLSRGRPFFVLLLVGTGLMFALGMIQWIIASIRSSNFRFESSPAFLLQTGQALEGVVLSMKAERFSHTREVLHKNLNITVTQYIPLQYNSPEVEQALEKFFQGSQEYHTDQNLKVFSNRMAFVSAMQAFVDNDSVGWDSWRFFFEDDISLHPSLTPDRAKEALAKGLALAAGDGAIYLGICGPTCSAGAVHLHIERRSNAHSVSVDAAQCSGTCAHAFGFKKWKAIGFLLHMNKLEMESEYKRMYFDQVLVAYALQVHRIWVVGSNLQSPAKGMSNHFGILFQDRDAFHSTISF